MSTLAERMADFRSRKIGHVDLPVRRAAFVEAQHPRVLHGEHGGEFARKPGGALTGAAPDFAGQMAKLWEDSGPDARLTIDNAQSAFRAGHYDKAAEYLRQAAGDEAAAGHPTGYTRLRRLSREISASMGENAALTADVKGFITKGSAAVPKVLGGGTEHWDGTLTVAPDLGTRYGGTVLAQVWAGGHMDMLESVAKGIRDDLAGKGEIASMDSFSVPLHELIHQNTGGRWEAQHRAHEQSGRSFADDEMLRMFRQLDRDSADGGIHVHKAADVSILGDAPIILEGVTRDIEDLVARGFLERWSAHEVGPNGETIPLWKRTAKAVATDPPGLPPTPDRDSHAYGSGEDVQAIEEGFTELGTITHAAQWFDAVGIGKRTTPVLAASGPHQADPVEKARLLRLLEQDAVKYGGASGGRDAGEAKVIAFHLREAAKALRADKENLAQKHLTAIIDQVGADKPLAMHVSEGLKWPLMQAYLPHTIDNAAYARKRDAMAKDLEDVRNGIALRMSLPVPPGDTTGTVYGAAELDMARRALTRAIGDLGPEPGTEDMLGLAEELANLRHVGDRELTAAADRLDKARREMAGTSVLKHATMSEYAKRLDDHSRIMSGDAWGHYGAWTAQALVWAEAVAMAEGKKGKAIDRRARELADEINREGAAGKLEVMAEQVLRATGRDLSRSPEQERVAMAGHLRNRWLVLGAAGAYDAMAKDAEEMRGVFG